MPLFSYMSRSLLRHGLSLATYSGNLNYAFTLKRLNHPTVFYEPYKEIQRSSSEKPIAAKIVGDLIKLWDKKNTKEAIRIIDIGSHDATMLTHCMTQANLPENHTINLLAVDKEDEVIESAKKTLEAFAADKRNVKYDTLVADIFSSRFLQKNSFIFPKANIILLMNVLYGTKKQAVESFLDVLQENFLAANGVIISAHAAEIPNGVIHLINQYSYNSKQLGEDGNDQPSLIKSILASNGINTATMRWPIRLYFRRPSEEEWKVLEDPTRHAELKEKPAMLKLLQILIFLCKELPSNMIKRSENDWDSLLESIKISASTNRINGSVCYLADEMEVSLIPSKYMKNDLKRNILDAAQKEFLSASILHKTLDVELEFYDAWKAQQNSNHLPEKPKNYVFSTTI